MYLCLCMSIKEDSLVKLAQKGLSREQALKKLGFGSDCGSCVLRSSKKCSQKRKFTPTKNNSR